MRVSSESPVTPVHPLSDINHFAGKNVSMVLFLTTLVNKFVAVLDPNKVADPILFANYIIGMICDSSNSQKPYIAHLMDLLYNVTPATSLFVLGDIVSIRPGADVKIPSVYHDGSYVSPLNYKIIELDAINMTAKIEAAFYSDQRSAIGIVPVQVLLPSEYAEVMWPEPETVAPQPTIDLRKG